LVIPTFFTDVEVIIISLNNILVFSVLFGFGPYNHKILGAGDAVTKLVPANKSLAFITPL
jgi:hypothetical protein